MEIFSSVSGYVKARIDQKLTPAMMNYLKVIEQRENQQKLPQFNRTIQIFGLSTDVTDEQVREFFSRYGEIESLSSAKRGEHVNETIFHYNILFKTVDAAANAINNAANDEKNANPRLSRDGLRVQSTSARNR